MSSSSPAQLLGQPSMSGQNWSNLQASLSSVTIAPLFPFFISLDMLITRLLNECYHFPGFVYENTRLTENKKAVEVDVRERIRSKPICSVCHEPGPCYDHLSCRRFEFIPIWGFAVFFLYCMRRVNCSTCGVKVEEVPWGTGKHTLCAMPICYTLRTGLGSYRGRKQQRVSTPVGIRSFSLYSTW